MVSTLWRCVGGAGIAMLAAVLVVTAGVGCSRTVDGTLQPSGPDGSVALTSLLIDPGRFPDNYSATVLKPQSAEQAIRDIGGVPAGSQVTPPECAPLPPGPAPQDAVAVQGVDEATSSRLTIALTQVDAGLTTRRDQVRGCPSFSVTTGDLTATVTTAPLPAPPVDTDDSFAVDQTVDAQAEPPARAKVLLGQIADVRITAAWQSAGQAARPDAEKLDTLFTDAVLKVRRGRP